MPQHPDIRTLTLASARKEFVDYFMENTKDMPDTNFDGQVARFLLASAAARRFVEESSERGRSRRDKMIAVFKGSLEPRSTPCKTPDNPQTRRI